MRDNERDPTSKKGPFGLGTAVFNRITGVLSPAVLYSTQRTLTT